MSEPIEDLGEYPITIDYDGDSVVQSVTDLHDWIEKRAQDYVEFLDQRTGLTPEFDTDDLRGLFVVQDSISYDPDNGVFTQEGTAPNFFGNTWSFATCRHMHRGHDVGNGGWNFDKFFAEDPEKDDLLWPKQPTLIICAASSQDLLDRSRRPVASIAFLNCGFWTVEAYARFLVENCNERAIGHRLTHDTASEFRSRAVKFGDCHSDRNGNVDEPPEGHDHHQGTESSCGCGKQLSPHEDTASDHVKCISLPGYWHAFSDQPEIEITGIGDRGVKYIRGRKSLDRHLKAYGTI